MTRTVLRPLLSLFLCLGLLLGLTACSGPVPAPGFSVDTPTPIITPPVSDAPQPEVTSDPVYSVSPDTSVGSDEPPVMEPVDQPPAIEIPTYQFGTPLAENEPVEDTYFDSAAFLGDSRTEGLQLFGGIRHGDYYWARGMTVFRVDDPNYAIFEIDGQMHTMMGALRQKEYASVYIMIGVNELGYAASSYEQGLNEFIDLVLEAQPNAVVYLQTLPPVNEEMAHKNNLGDYINNSNIGKFNDAIIRIATEKKIVLLDTAEAYRDENGILPAELASDGCHFNFNGYTPWADYLRSHVMEFETYQYNRWAEPAEQPSQPTEEAPDA